MTALEWFDKAIEREKAARAAKGMSTELGADIIRLLSNAACSQTELDEEGS